jgi:hypothetical protein
MLGDHSRWKLNFFKKTENIFTQAVNHTDIHTSHHTTTQFTQVITPHHNSHKSPYSSCVAAIAWLIGVAATISRSELVLM